MNRDIHTTRGRCRDLLFAFLLVCAPVAAQQLIGVNLAGEAFVIDSLTGVGTSLGATGQVGVQAMARKGGTLWICSASTVNVPNTQFHLAILDEHTGVANRIFSTISGELRALAATGTFGRLLGVTNAAGAPGDLLVEVNVLDGTLRTIGPVTFNAIQGMALHGNQFFGWEQNLGLVRIDFRTGVATRVNAAVGNGGVQIQFLASLSDGRLVGGRNELYVIDTTTGVPTLIGSGGYSDLRAADERFGTIQNFGQGCASPTGTARISALGEPSPGQTLSLRSGGHARGAVAVLCLGASRRSHQGTPLPFLVDPILGTQNCNVWVSLDITLVSTVNLLGLANQNLALPNNFDGGIFHAQYAVFENVPGGVSFTDALRVQVAL